MKSLLKPKEILGYVVIKWFLFSFNKGLCPKFNISKEVHFLDNTKPMQDQQF